MAKDEIQNTNLASEFFVASQLFRLGYIVTITLGHTKEVDLIVVNKEGRKVSIDVKGLVGRTNWPLNPKLIREDHFYILITHKDKFNDLNTIPEVYIIPSVEINNLLTKWKNRSGVTYKTLKNSKYNNAWHLLFSEVAIKNNLTQDKIVKDVFDLNYHLQKSQKNIQEKFIALRNNILNLPNVTEQANQKTGITYKSKKSFALFQFQNSQINIYLRDSNYKDDKRNLIKDVTDRIWGYNGLLKLESNSDINYIFNLIRGSYYSSLYS